MAIVINKARPAEAADLPTAPNGKTAPNTSVVAAVSDTNVATTILAANGNRKGASIFNDSTVVLNLLCGAGTPSNTNFTVRIAGGQLYELPNVRGGVYTGIIMGVWDSDAAGAARITEWT